MTEPLGYRVAEAAKLLGVSPTTIRNAVARGDLRAARLGSALVIPRIEILRFLGLPIDPPSSDTVTAELEAVRQRIAALARSVGFDVTDRT